MIILFSSNLRVTCKSLGGPGNSALPSAKHEMMSCDEESEQMAGRVTLRPAHHLIQSTGTPLRRQHCRWSEPSAAHIISLSRSG